MLEECYIKVHGIIPIADITIDLIMTSSKLMFNFLWNFHIFFIPHRFMNIAAFKG